jgi:hypothetical protein
MSAQLKLEILALLQGSLADLLEVLLICVRAGI